MDDFALPLIAITLFAAIVNGALGYLADAKMKTAGDNKDAAAALERLKKWTPTEKDSVTDLAARIDDWQRFFSLVK